MGTCKIVEPAAFDFDGFRAIKAIERKGKPSDKLPNKYKNIVTAFDIETSHIKEIDQSVMYVWQWQSGLDVTVMGRTWTEFKEFIEKLSACLAEDEYIVTYVHNLSYEFQFLRILGEWNQDDVFALDSRKVLKATMGKIEFRCAYLHSNMSLGEYTNKMQVEHKKLDGKEFNYNEERYWFTPLTDRQKQYCQNDVLGLVEAITKEMEIDKDNLFTIPLTSTGYVRRDVKRAMFSQKSAVQKIVPDFEVYTALREAFRGGNTHANRYFVGDIIDNVKSVDISSSYPSQQCEELFPMSAWRRETNADIELINRLINIDRRAVLFRVGFTNIRLSDKLWGCPYLSKDKARNSSKLKIDNGRILSAEYLEITVTDLDFKIIADTYEWDDVNVGDTWSARYGYLPQELRDVVKDYFTRKTKLKGIKEQEIYYTKAKNLLNSVYGMSAQNPVKLSMLFVGGFDPFKPEDKEQREILEENNKKAFFSYTWGVWTTAWARTALHRGLRIVHDSKTAHFLYCDTDSVKFFGEADFTEYNKEREKIATACGAYADDSKGVRHYMGVYEDDAEYSRFVTLGAKKYAYIKKGKDYIGCTVSGVAKDSRDKQDNVIRRGGGCELMEKGGLEAFKQGFKFTEAGGTESVYNDIPPVTSITVDGHIVDVGPNIVIKDSTYTLGITEDYRDLIESLDRTGFWV